MKSNHIYINSAIMSAFMKFYSIHDLAVTISETALKEANVELEVYNCKSDGFVLRRKKDIIVSEADLTQIFIKAIKAMIKEMDDGVESYIFDQYDFEFTKDMINHGFISQIFDIEKNGRLISIEIDI